MTHYIYKFLNTDEVVIYVGITTNLKGRIRAQHFTRNGHLPMECYKQTSVVLYSECASPTDAKIKERYLINKLSPAFNVKMNRGDAITWSIEDFDWKYIGFDNERVHNDSNEGRRRRRVKADNQSLKYMLGSEVQFDLSSAVRPSPLPGTIWLDAVAVEKTGFSWHEHHDCFPSYLAMTLHEHMVSFKSSWFKDDEGKPIWRLIASARDEADLAESKRSPFFQSRGLSCKEWLVVAAEFNPSDVRVRMYTESEQLAVDFEARLDQFKNAIYTEDGWTVIAALDDLFPGECHVFYDKKYWDLCDSLGEPPGFSHYENGNFQHGYHVQMPDHVREFAQYQQQLQATAGVDVYATRELNEYIAKHKTILRKLLPSLARRDPQPAGSTIQPLRPE